MSHIFQEIRWYKPEVDGEEDGIEGPYIHCNRNVNSRIYLCQGDVWKLPVDAIVVGQNESLADRTECEPLIALAGPETERDMYMNVPVQTGDSCLCTGANLCPYIIFGVCPKYTAKYISACDNALYGTYKSSLIAALEKPDIKSIAFTALYLKKSRYPRDEGAHIALRTIRRFLEHSLCNQFEKIIFCVDEDDFQLYNLLMTAYFPRNESEVLSQVELLPEHGAGDEWGDASAEERSVKITTGPRRLSQKERKEMLQKAAAKENADDGNTERLLDLDNNVFVTMTKTVKSGGGSGKGDTNGGRSRGSSAIMAESPPVFSTTGSQKSQQSGRESGREGSVNGDYDVGYSGGIGGIGGTTASSMQDFRRNSDQERIAKLRRDTASLTREDRLRAHYNHLASASKEEDFSDVEEMKFIDFAGKDRQGKTIVFITAAYIKIPDEDPTVEDNTGMTMQLRTVMYIIRKMDQLICRPYVIVYACSGVQADSAPSNAWINAVFDLFYLRYAANLQRLYVLHASTAMRVYLFVACPFLENTFWKDYRVIGSLSELNDYMPVSQLNLTAIVTEYDRRTFPTHYLT